MQELSETQNVELAAFVRSHHVGAVHCSLSRRSRPATGRVKAWALSTADGTTPTHTECPAFSADEIAAEVYAAAEEHAAKHGGGQYVLELQRARKDRGPAPNPDRLSFTAGDSSPPVVTPQVESNAALLAVIDDQRKQQGELWKQCMSLLDKVTSMVSANTSTITSLAGAWDRFHAARSQSVSGDVEAQAIASEERQHRERMQLARQALSPLLAALQSSMRKKLPPGSQAPVITAPSPSSTTPTDAKPESDHPLVHDARRFAYGCSAEVADRVTSTTGHDLVSQLAKVESPHDVCSVVARVVELEPSQLMAAAEALTPEQCEALTKLQEDATAFACATP